MRARISYTVDHWFLARNIHSRVLHFGFLLYRKIAKKKGRRLKKILAGSEIHRFFWSINTKTMKGLILALLFTTGAYAFQSQIKPASRKGIKMQESKAVS